MGEIPAPTPTPYSVTLPGGSNDTLNANQIDPLTTTALYYGPTPTQFPNPDGLLIAVPFGDDMSIFPYCYSEGTIPLGGEVGNYTFHFDGGVDVPVLNSTYYPDVLTIASPQEGTSVNASNGINITWNNLGANYTYVVTASTPYVNNNCSAYWSSQNVEFIPLDPSSIQSLISNDLTTNSVTIPTSVFSSGSTVELTVMAIDTNSVSYTADNPIGPLVYAVSRCDSQFTVQ